MQMEDELASIGAVMGASWAGKKAMTATSGPGFSLMQETIGWGFMTETPCVIVDVQRVGPGTGQATKCGQGDVMQARWGTHGDYASIALSPNSAQEMFELAIRAFNLAEKYRTPVILLADETIAREEVSAAWELGDHAHTFMGNPVVCAAALASIEVMRKEKLVERSARLGQYVMKALQDIAKKREVIGEVRGEGLMIGLELVVNKEKKTPLPRELMLKIQSSMIDRGVFISYCGVKNNVLRISLALNIPKEMMDRALEALDETLRGIPCS
jgi:pyruvate/2-oxoacid:ferredoxin oxidoreductase alpha subunit